MATHSWSSLGPLSPYPLVLGGRAVLRVLGGRTFEEGPLATFQHLVSCRWVALLFLCQPRAQDWDYLLECTFPGTAQPFPAALAHLPASTRPQTNSPLLVLEYLCASPKVCASVGTAYCLSTPWSSTFLGFSRNKKTHQSQRSRVTCVTICWVWGSKRSQTPATFLGRVHGIL